MLYFVKLIEKQVPYSTEWSWESYVFQYIFHLGWFQLWEFKKKKNYVDFTLL